MQIKYITSYSYTGFFQTFIHIEWAFEWTRAWIKDVSGNMELLIICSTGGPLICPSIVTQILLVFMASAMVPTFSGFCHRNFFIGCLYHVNNNQDHIESTGLGRGPFTQQGEIMPTIITLTMDMLLQTSSQKVSMN